MVRADGDCLPGCASMFAYGNDNHPAEMRVRIIHELALHDDYYLNGDNLSRGLATSDPEKVIKNFYMYSPEYISDTKKEDMNYELFRSAFEGEAMKISKPKVYMGIWQVCAVSSILKSPVFSVHPRLGNPFVRFDLHRLILPRPQNALGCHDNVATPNNPLVIMWTTTRQDMTKGHWVGNHFVVAVPDETDSLGDQARRSDQMFDIPPPEECNGLWVLVQYDRKPYPGVVEEVDGEEISVNCMNAVGKGFTNSFFWPQTYQDLCWYDHDKILAIIPEPVRKNNAAGHFSVDEAIWRAVVSKLKA